MKQYINRAFTAMRLAGEGIESAGFYMTHSSAGVYSESTMFIYAADGVVQAENETAAFAMARRIEGADSIEVRPDAAGRRRLYANGRLCAQPKRCLRLGLHKWAGWESDARAVVSYRELVDGILSLCASNPLCQLRVCIGPDVAKLERQHDEPPKFSIPLLGGKTNWAIMATYEARRLLASLKFVVDEEDDYLRICVSPIGGLIFVNSLETKLAILKA